MAWLVRRADLLHVGAPIIEARERERERARESGERERESEGGREGGRGRERERAETCLSGGHGELSKMVLRLSISISMPQRPHAPIVGLAQPRSCWFARLFASYGLWLQTDMFALRGEGQKATPTSRTRDGSTHAQAGRHQASRFKSSSRVPLPEVGVQRFVQHRSWICALDIALSHPVLNISAAFLTSIPGLLKLNWRHRCPSRDAEDRNSAVGSNVMLVLCCSCGSASSASKWKEVAKPRRVHTRKKPLAR